MVAARRMASRMANADGLADEARRPIYDPMLDLARASLEFGYVLMFTVVWPLAPLCCLLISVLEQRTAALRLTVGCQRPATGLRCDGLGVGDAWFHVFTLLAWVSVPINCGMIALATRQLDDARDAIGVHGLVELPPFEKLLIAVIAEHILLAAKLVISVVYDDQPADAGGVDEEHRRKYLLGVYGELNGAASHQPSQPQPPQLRSSLEDGSASGSSAPTSPGGDEWRQRLDLLLQPTTSLPRMGFGQSDAATSNEPRNEDFHLRPGPDGSFSGGRDRNRCIHAHVTHFGLAPPSPRVT